VGPARAGPGRATADPRPTGQKPDNPPARANPPANTGWRLLRNWEHKAAVTVLTWGPDRLMSGDEGGGLTYRNVRTGEAGFDVKEGFGVFKGEDARPITYAFIQPDDIGAQIVVGRQTILHMDMREDRFTFRGSGGGDWNAFGAAPDGSVWLASLGLQREVQFPLNTLSGKEPFGEVEGDVEDTR